MASTVYHCRLAMLAAFVHQLAACPCGCPEHNFWLQSLAVIIQAELPTNHGSRVPADITAIAANDEDEHCHCEVPTPYMCGPQGKGLQQETIGSGLPSSLLSAIATSGALPSAVHSIAGCCQFSAPPVRAQLGVYLI